MYKIQKAIKKWRFLRQNSEILFQVTVSIKCAIINYSYCFILSTLTHNKKAIY